jgi:hypothetical protein
VIILGGSNESSGYGFGLGENEGIRGDSKSSNFFKSFKLNKKFLEIMLFLKIWIATFFVEKFLYFCKKAKETFSANFLNSKKPGAFRQTRKNYRSKLLLSLIPIPHVRIHVKSVETFKICVRALFAWIDFSYI